MDQIIGYIFGAVLLITAVGLFRWHRRSWHAVQDDLDDPQQQEFFRRQFRRRAQISVMLGLVAVTLLGAQLISPDDQPSLFVGIWVLISILVLWITLLALIDLVSLRQHAQLLSLRLIEEQGRLHGEIRRLQKEQAIDGNGHLEESSSED